MRRPASLALYATAAGLAGAFAPGILQHRVWRGKEDPERLGERLGRAVLPRPDGRLVWLHGASVGEGLSLLPLIDQLRATRPDLGVLITTGTRASAELMAQRLPEGVIHQFAPVDTPAAAARFIAHWRPDLGVFVESELWPNLIAAARAGGARLALVSARISEASFRGWRRFPDAAAMMLGAFDLIMARDEAAATRFTALGGRVEGVWDAKLGAEPLPADPEALATLREALADRPMLLAASTHAGEDAMVMSAFAQAAEARPDALLVLAPRHPIRGGEVEAQARAQGLPTARRSLAEDPAGARVYIADTLGEIGLFLRLASLAIVGGSLIAGTGGHNPMEPARLGCPFVVGPHTEHWPVYEVFLTARSTLRVESANQIAAVMSEALAGRLAKMSARASKVAARLDGESRALAPRLLAMVEP
ncbi:MAG: glycosyltransferase N-terminal domain-containing protein [Caulobacteraceae bacterium]